VFLFPWPTENTTRHPDKIYHSASKQLRLVISGFDRIKGRQDFIQERFSVQRLAVSKVQGKQPGALG